MYPKEDIAMQRNRKISEARRLEKIQTDQVCQARIQSGIERQSKIEIKEHHYHGIKYWKQKSYLK